LSHFAVKTIIHGHFYQPPREDPWTNQIEEQTSAHPYKNWNLRITKECYGANCYSRVLDNNGKIIDIINNYEYISFNFGPTLLSWLEKKCPDVYKKILEADRKSIELHNGHGNAIAQVYNHVIMPLQNYEDKKTQIIWGLKDFEKRFHRKSEGMWLAETAIDYETIDLLINFGIKYVILSPYQALRYRKIGEERWHDALKSTLPTNRHYKVKRENGEIAVFYYDKKLSTAVSFEHLLHSSDNFANSIMHGRHENDLVVIATDGEIYGHHEPFGDMCLARLIREYHQILGKIKLMNFAEFLADNPPQYETEIYLGDDGLGSSWSCSHGVGRWYKDCGCNTGGQPGWNQKWRGPLREGFNDLKKEIDKIYFNETLKYSQNPIDLRNDYIEYILSDYNNDGLQFLKRNIIHDIKEEDLSRLLKLLESQKYAMFMFTSCGWFFSEISGIETIQNMHYAYRAITLLDEKFHDGLINILENQLEKAESNIKEKHNGKWLLKNVIYNSKKDLARIAASFISVFKATGRDITGSLEFFEYFDVKKYIIKNVLFNSPMHEGSITVFDKRCMESLTFDFLFIELANSDFVICIVDKEKKDLLADIKRDFSNNMIKNEKYIKDGVLLMTKSNLSPEIQKFITEYLYAEKKKNMMQSAIRAFNELRPLLIFYKESNTPLPQIYMALLKFAGESIFQNIYENSNDFPDRDTMLLIMDLLNLVGFFSITINTDLVKEKFAIILYEKLKEVDLNIKYHDVFKKALILIEFCNKTNLIIEKSRVENLIFKLLKENVKGLIEKINFEERVETRNALIMHFRNLIILADNFNINTEKEKDIFFKFIKKHD
jgi:hypothetical protein